VAVCEDGAVPGSPFAIAEFVDGTCVRTRADLEALDPQVRDQAVDQLTLTLAHLHAVDHIRVGLEGWGPAHSYAARQLHRWSSQWQLVGDPALSALAAEVTRALQRHPPEQHAVSIVHGDFRIDNTLLDLAKDVAVAAVVDWELSTIGDPVADVATMCAYRHPAFDLVLGEPSAWASDRLPDAQSLAVAYERAGGVQLQNWEAHLALAHFKLAVIAAGIDHRFRRGGGYAPAFPSASRAIEPLLDEARTLIVNGRTG
jgi:aminoglycoside phosphotransferase (APT) family kinase protein